MCFTFKQQAIQRDIHAMRDQDGNIRNTWEGIGDMMRSHFVSLLGTEVLPDEDALHEVLEAQTNIIPPDDAAAMEQPISLEELHVAAKALAKQKVLGKDGLPMEFFLALWEQVGPLLLKVLQNGISKGCLHPKLTEGIMVMLEKKGDQLLIGNKRGLILLNCVLKILAKLYQLRLTKVLQEFIIEQ